MQKQHVIFFPGFATNAYILQGIIEYLNDFFVVHPLDPPGFSPESSPLEHISVATIQQAAREQVEALELDSYIIGGASFGFLLANYCATMPECKGVIAFAPYINQLSLMHSKKELRRLSWLLRTLQYTFLDAIIWRNDFLYKKIWRSTMNGEYHYVFDQIRETFDRKTLLTIASELLVYKQLPALVEKPYALVMYPEDQVVSYTVATKTLQAANKVHILDTALEHFPERFTREYVAARVSHEGMKKVADYFSNNYVTH